VEVIKGNASALYGSAAMAGVVNLISRRPAAEPVHEFLVNRSTWAPPMFRFSWRHLGQITVDGIPSGL
jgi:outer membrane receptor protein involved in Fe transport